MVWSRWSAFISIESGTTETVQKLLFGKCVQCTWKKSIVVSDNTRQVGSLCIFFKTTGSAFSKAGEKLATI